MIGALGKLIFLLVVIISYFSFFHHKRKNAVKISDNKIFSQMKKEPEIKRHIRLKASSDIGSPTLVDVLFPTVYIPCLSIPDYNMHLVLLHELTHCKRNVIEQIGSKKHHKISTFKAVLTR